jgi:hypothetical protein
MNIFAMPGKTKIIRNTEIETIPDITDFSGKRKRRKEKSPCAFLPLKKP